MIYRVCLSFNFACLFVFRDHEGKRESMCVCVWVSVLKMCEHACQCVFVCVHIPLPVVDSVREGFFLVPISPPVHFEGVQNRHLFSWRAILWTAWVYGRTRAQLWGAVERDVCFYVLCTSMHQHIEPTVLCAEFATWIVVLLFMPKGLHFAGIHTAYRERQRNLTAHHYSFFSARPQVHSGDHELTGTKKKKGFPEALVAIAERQKNTYCTVRYCIVAQRRLQVRISRG